MCGCVAAFRVLAASLLAAPVDLQASQPPRGRPRSLSPYHAGSSISTAGGGESAAAVARSPRNIKFAGYLHGQRTAVACLYGRSHHASAPPVMGKANRKKFGGKKKGGGLLRGAKKVRVSHEIRSSFMSAATVAGGC